MAVLIPVALLWIQVQFGALRVLERLPGPGGDLALVAVWGGSAGLAWGLLTGRLRLPWRALRTPWPAAVLVALVAVCAVFVYPEVDGRRATGAGSDADDAVVLVAERLRDGDDPFAEDTYLGNPPTTGPGSALWALLLPGRRAYATGVVVALAGTLALLRRWTGDWRVPSLTALLLGASVPFWEGVAQGSDHLTMACGLALVVAAVTPVEPPAGGGSSASALRRAGAPGTGGIVALAVAAGALATWRAAYLHLPALLALALWRRAPRPAVAVGVLGTAVALALHASLLARTDGWDAYDPVQQLVVKSDEDLTAAGRAVLVVGVAAAGVAVLAEARRRSPRPDVLVLAGIGGPLAAIAVVGAFTAVDPAGWSEASYLLPTLVLASASTARWVVRSRAP